MSDIDGRDLDGFSDAAKRVVQGAEREARELEHDAIGTEHLLLGVLTTAEDVGTVLARNGATVAATRRKVQEARPAAAVSRRRREPQLETTPRAARALVRAVRFAHQARSNDVEPAHLLLAVIDVEGTASLVLRGLGVDLDALRAGLLGEQPAPSVGVDVSRPSPMCPSCRASLVDAIHAHETHASDASGTHRHVTVFACASCGVALGVSG